MRLVTSIFICAFSFTLMFNVSAQGLSERSYQELKKGFAIGLRNESNARSKISLFQLSPRKTTLLVNHYLSLANDDDLVSRLFEEVVATGLIDRVVEDPTISYSKLHFVLESTCDYKNLSCVFVEAGPIPLNPPSPFASHHPSRLQMFACKS